MATSSSLMGITKSAKSKPGATVQPHSVYRSPRTRGASGCRVLYVHHGRGLGTSMRERYSARMALERKVLDERVDALAPSVIEIARKIHETPELRFAEPRTSRWISDAASLPG